MRGIDGSRVYEFYMKNRHVEIADYCLRDVLLTREIYYRMQFEECTQTRAMALAKAI
jgi:predicted PolB exonuclease-like 3'-5' exonuclease